MKRTSHISHYQNKIEETKKELALIETKLNGKYDEELIQRRNNLYTDLDSYKRKLSWYSNSNRDAVQMPLDINIEILKP
jgi:hypothetical protein